MKLKFETFFRGFIVILSMILFWSFWASAQEKTTTNVVATIETSVKDSEATVQEQKSVLTFGLDRIKVLQPELAGNPRWKYVASFIYIVFAFYISKFLDFLTRVWLKKLAARTSTKLDDLILDLLNGPIKIVAFIIFLRIGLNVFDWPEFVQNGLSYGFTIIVAITITYMVLKMIDLLMTFWRNRAKEGETDRGFDEQLFPIIRKSLKVFIIVVATLVTLDNIGINITAAIASLSIGGLAVGLAAQDTLANLFGTVAIFMDKPFRVGDRIKLDGVDGPVESIGLRSTRVRNLDGHLITIPNKTMGNATITNITRRPNIKSTINIGITYDTPAGKVKRAIDILTETYKANPKTADLIISFNQFADSSLNILVVHWWGSTDFKEYLAGMQELNLQIKERFDAEKISFAFPSRTVFVKQDSEWRFGNGAEKTSALATSDSRGTNDAEIKIT